MLQNYSGIQKFLHDFVLSKKFINKSLFEIEKIIYLKEKTMILTEALSSKLAHPHMLCKEHPRQKLEFLFLISQGHA